LINAFFLWEDFYWGYFFLGGDFYWGYFFLGGDFYWGYFFLGGFLPRGDFYCGNFFLGDFYLHSMQSGGHNGHNILGLSVVQAGREF
jgi:hypothetical protein